jgi:hypothetical protein
MADIRFPAVVTDPDALSCFHAEHIPDVIDVASLDKNLLSLYLTGFYKKLIHTPCFLSSFLR